MEASTIAIAGYLLLLSAVAGATLLSEEAHLAGFAVIAIWAVGEVAAQLGYTSPAALYLALDATACWYFWSMRTAGAKLFAATYAAQVALHIAFLSNLALSPMSYWWAHAITAYTQLLVLLGWTWQTRGKVYQ